MNRVKIKRIVDKNTIKIEKEIRGTDYVELKNSTTRKLRVGQIISIIPRGRSYNRLIARIKNGNNRN